MNRAWITPSQRDALLEAGWLDEAGVNRLRESNARVLAELEAALGALETAYDRMKRHYPNLRQGILERMNQARIVIASAKAIL